MGLKKILVVEDEEFYQEILSRYIGSRVVLLQAFTIEQAEKLFAENPDIGVIVMDACVPGNEPTTLPLVRKIRQTFTGPIIAASSSSEYRKKLLTAGCDYECEKEMAYKKVMELVSTL